MNEKLTQMLDSITESRTNKYNEEVERQKTAIEEALFKALKARKAATDDMARATINQQGKNYIWFEFTLDASVLPEVAAYINDEFGIEVDGHDNRKVCAQYQA